MGDDEKKQGANQDPTKEALESSVKNAANAYAGPVGGKVADMAMKTGAGQDLINKGSQALNSLPGPGKLPGAGGTSNPGQADGVSNDDSNGLEESNTNNPLDFASRFREKSSSKTEGTFDLFDNKGLKKKIIIAGASFLGVFLIIILFVLVLYGPINSIKDFIEGVWNKTVDFFSKDTAEFEEEYYQKLIDVRDDIRDKKSVCIDINMIHAALTVNKNLEEALIEGDCIIDEDGNQICDLSAKEKEEKKELKQMKNQVELLANMQIKTIIYGYDKNLKNSNYCVPCNKSKTSVYSTDTLVDSSNIGDFVNDKFNLYNKDSSSAELIASHDAKPIQRFFSKKSNDEKNYEFRFYIPIAVSDGLGGCKCDNDLPDEKTFEMSVGNYDTRKDNVFYWNLINSFVPSYYDEYLEGLTDEEKEKKIIDIADNIYLLYDEYGPDDSCGMTCSTVVLDSSGLCPNGIEVDGNLVTLEDYVAGVVSRENNWHQGDNIETLKAQAIAARTYAINRTNYCQSAIGNSSSTQNYSPTSDPYILRAVSETSGIILTDNGSRPISAEYDASAVKEVSEEAGGYVLNQNDQLIPFESADIIGMASRHKCVCKKYATTNDSSCNNSCHGRGMSQIGARYLQTQGYTYDEILKYYYGDYVQLTSTNNEISADNSTRVLTLCTSVNGSSPDGTLTSGRCYTNSYYLDTSNKETKYWSSSLNPYYSKYVGECTWYAFGRSLKALVEDAGMTEDDAKTLLKKTFLHRSNNGGEWYKNATLANTLRFGNDIDAITPGSIVSSSGSGSAGHVFFVEGVNYNNDGTVDSLIVTERLGKTYCVYGTKKVSKKGNAVYVNRDQFYGFVSILGG